MKKTALVPSATTAWLIAAAAGFAWWTNRYFSIDQWLVFLWMRAWAATLLFALSSLAVGTWLLARLRIPFGTLAERFTLAFAAGVLVFVLGIFVFGSVGLLGAAFFWLWPAALLAAGWRTLARQVRHVVHACRRAGGRAFLPATGMQAVAMALVLLGTLALYIQVLTPGNISFDARWYHLPIAESYAAAGRIRPFPEGWYMAAYPHLASWLYTWAFLAPGGVRHHLCLAGHLEFVVFLGTLPGVGAFGARLLERRRLAGAAAALFLFPTMFAYGPNLNSGADHVMALWAVPIGLVLLRYLTSGQPALALLLGAFLGAAGCTKYQAIYWIPPIALLVAIHAVRTRAIRPMLLTLLAAVVMWAPFWLKNLMAYGDPVYPNLHRWLHVHPFYPGAGEMMKRFYDFGSGGVSLGERLREAPLDTLTFSFWPYGYGRYGHSAPVFGSLFTLLVPLAFVVRPRRRLVMVVLCLHLSLIVWDVIFPQERYLQAILPWMAAFVAAVILWAWQLRSTAVRVGLGLLIGVQLAWRSDTFFFRNHAMIGDAPIKGFLDYVWPTETKPNSDRRYPGEDLAAIGAALPRNARVVVHDLYQSMGIGVWPIIDNPYWEGALEYLQTDTPAATMAAWRKLGATHVLWPENKGQDLEGIARDVVIARAKLLYGGPSLHIAGYEIFPVGETVPDGRFAASPTRIAWLTCRPERALGIYTPEGLSSGTPAALLDAAGVKANAGGALAGANVALTRLGCPEVGAATPVLAAQFRWVTNIGDIAVWARPAP